MSKISEDPSASAEGCIDEALDRYERNFNSSLRLINHPCLSVYVYLRRDYETAEQGASPKLSTSDDGSQMVRELCDTNAVIK